MSKPSGPVNSDQEKELEAQTPYHSPREKKNDFTGILNGNNNNHKIDFDFTGVLFTVYFYLRLHAKNCSTFSCPTKGGVSPEIRFCFYNKI